jgi:hypothetical protein
MPATAATRRSPAATHVLRVDRLPGTGISHCQAGSGPRLAV